MPHVKFLSSWDSCGLAAHSFTFYQLSQHGDTETKGFCCSTNASQATRAYSVLHNALGTASPRRCGVSNEGRAERDSGFPSSSLQEFML